MMEYISREEAIKELWEVYEHEYPTASGDFDEYASHDVPNTLRNIPFADVQPINPLVKIEERVPDVSGNYLCYLATGEFEVLYFDREIEDDEYNDDYPFGVWNTYPSEDGGECREWIEVLEVTHWMPLPEPPKDGDVE